MIVLELVLEGNFVVFPDEVLLIPVELVVELVVDPVGLVVLLELVEVVLLIVDPVAVPVWDVFALFIFKILSHFKVTCYLHF